MTETRVHAQGAVVVGVEGTGSDTRPLEAAVIHARLHQRPLHVLHATAIGIVPWTPERLDRQRARTAMALARARALGPDLTVTSATVVDDQSAALVAASRTASLLVMGAGRLGRAGSIMLGATTGRVASHAQCPVLVVPEDWSPTEDLAVVVGVDDDEHSRPAVEWAFAEASVRRAPLVAVHAWWWEALGPMASDIAAERERGVAGWEAAAESQHLMMGEMVAGCREKYPDVEARTEFVRGEATSTLEEASRDAQLLVVGTRGRGGFAGLLLGSVSSRALHHSHCPVVVVPSPRGHRAA